MERSVFVNGVLVQGSHELNHGGIMYVVPLTESRSGKKMVSINGFHVSRGRRHKTGKVNPKVKRANQGGQGR